NGVTVEAFGSAGDARALAGQMVNAVNASTDRDPFSNRPINELIQAELDPGPTANEAGITFTQSDRGVRLELSVSDFVLAQGSEFDYSIRGPNQGPWKLQVSGLITVGSVLLTIVDGLEFRYTVVAKDTPSSISSAIALAIGSSTLIDPFTGLML